MDVKTGIYKMVYTKKKKGRVLLKTNTVRYALYMQNPLLLPLPRE